MCRVCSHFVKFRPLSRHIKKLGKSRMSSSVTGRESRTPESLGLPRIWDFALEYPL